MTINTLLFDLDGTLINTNDLIISSFEHTLEEFFPGQFSREKILEFMGPPLSESFESIAAPNQVEDMIKVYREYNLSNHDLLVTEFDGVFETVKQLAERGFKLAIVSTKMHDTVVKGLKLTNLDQFFDVVIGLDDVTKAKPDPEPVQKALDALGSRAEEAIMIGDNYHDILAGKNAGTKTAGVAWSAKGKDFLAEYEPDFMLEHMSDLVEVVGAGKRG